MQAILSEQEYQEYLKLKADAKKSGMDVDARVAQEIENIVIQIRNAANLSATRGFLSGEDILDALGVAINQIRARKEKT